jgi:hypothetical protein
LKSANSTIEAANLATVNQLKEISTEFQNLKKLVPNDIKNISVKNTTENLSAAQKHLQNKAKFN